MFAAILSEFENIKQNKTIRLLIIIAAVIDIAGCVVVMLPCIRDASVLPQILGDILGSFSLIDFIHK